MPVVFKEVKREPYVLELKGTKFFFDVTERMKRQATINAGITGGPLDFGKLMYDFFRVALYGWENLVNEKGEQVKFSIPVRDALMDLPDLFTVNHVYDIFLEETFAKKDIKKKVPKVKSTLKNASPKP